MNTITTTTTSTASKATEAASKASTASKATEAASKATEAASADKTFRQKLADNIGLRTLLDGTTRGQYKRMKKADFASAETFEAYRLSLAYASTMFIRSIVEADNNKSAQIRNKGMAHVNDAVRILAAECGMNPDTFNVSKRHVRAWLAAGAVARVSTDYSSGQRTLEQKTIPMLQRFIELDCADVLNGRIRLGDTYATNEKTAAIIASATASASEKTSTATASKASASKATASKASKATASK